jgi:hypothetical protein
LQGLRVLRRQDVGDQDDGSGFALRGEQDAQVLDRQ